MRNLYGQSANISSYVGHGHFWERALTRRGFLTTAAGTLGLALGSNLWLPELVYAAKRAAAPKPIPGGIQFLGPGTELFHVFLPERGNELSTITDFHGFIGAAQILGNGTGTNPKTRATRRLFFDADMRFMRGHYISVDGRERQGTFGFF